MREGGGERGRNVSEIIIIIIHTSIVILSATHVTFDESDSSKVIT